MKTVIYNQRFQFLPRKQLMAIYNRARLMTAMTTTMATTTTTTKTVKIKTILTTTLKIAVNLVFFLKIARSLVKSFSVNKIHYKTETATTSMEMRSESIRNNHHHQQRQQQNSNQRLYQLKNILEKSNLET